MSSNSLGDWDLESAATQVARMVGEIQRLRLELEFARAAKDSAVQQAQIWHMEAITQKSIAADLRAKADQAPTAGSLRCITCGDYLPTQEAMRQHDRERHDRVKGTTLWTCDYCGALYSSLQDALNHKGACAARLRSPHPPPPEAPPADPPGDPL